MRVIKKAAKILSDSNSFVFYGKIARMAINWTPRFLLYNRFNVWGKHRELPDPPKESFREWYQKNHEGNE
jgi:L-lactate dehydrogenase complex protein LldF